MIGVPVPTISLISWPAGGGPPLDVKRTVRMTGVSAGAGLRFDVRLSVVGAAVIVIGIELHALGAYVESPE